MAFPQVATESAGSLGSGTSHTVDLPASIASGDLLLAYFTVDGDPTMTWPAGWELIGALDGGGTNASGQARYRIADGTEGASITVTTSVSEFSVHQTYRITGWHGTTPPEFASSNWAASTTPDPPSLAPSWGAEDTLWFASVLVNNGSDGAVTGFPANYANGVNREGGGQFDDTTLGVARRELNAASEDPGTFTISAQQFEAAHTIAVRPAAAGGGQTIAVGQSAETDLAQAVAWAPKHRLVGQTVETDLARPMGRLKVVLVGQSLEADFAQAVTSGKVKLLGQALESDLAQAITVGQAIIVAVGQATETDLAQAVTAVGGGTPTGGSRSARAILLALS